MSRDRVQIIAWITAGAATAGLLASGCAAMDQQAASSAAGQPTIVDGAIDAVTAANYGIGAGLAGLWGAYQLLRKRTRTEWVAAGKALLPLPGDASVRVADALRHVDNALGGGHTSRAP